MRVILRELEWVDLPDVVALESELFPTDGWSPATWWNELAGRPRRDYLVAVDADNGLLGYAGADHGGDVTDVMTVAVDPRHRGLGLGHRLVDELERRARSRGAFVLLLEVRADNDGAIGLYKSSGFHVIQTRRRYYQPGDIDALVMRKLLSDNETVSGEEAAQ